MTVIIVAGCTQSVSIVRAVDVLSLADVFGYSYDPMRRYDAILHGRHTHGHIVVRQPMVSQDGIQVLQHLAEQLATHAPHTILRSESVPIFVLHESDAQVA